MIRLYDNPLLEALGSAISTARQAGPAVAKSDVCPGCDGSGRARHRVPNGPEPYVWTHCPACSGTGAVAVDAVVHCTECDTPCWADQVCTHQGVALCADCRPAAVCHDCVDEQAERVGEYR